MFTIKADPNNKRVFHITANMPINSKKGITQGLKQFGSLLKEDLRAEILRKPKSGREYFIRRGGRAFRHIASAPGETPANITGKLRGSVSYKVTNGEMEFGYSNNVEYGKFLEDGTKKMDARPGLLNSINRKQQQGLSMLKNSVLRSMINE